MTAKLTESARQRAEKHSEKARACSTAHTNSCGRPIRAGPPSRRRRRCVQILLNQCL